MLRRFSWASNSLWPEDLKANNIPATIVLTENDEIVPAAAVEELFSDFNSKIKKSEQEQASVVTFKDASHGEMFMMESLRETTANMVIDMIEDSRKNNVHADSLSQLKKDYQSSIWDQISYHILSRGEQNRPKKMESNIFL